MHLLTHSALLRALGWSLFNSLWQMSLLWAFYHLFLLVFKNLPARARHGLALLLLTTGFIWSVTSFVTAYFFRDVVPASVSGKLLFSNVLGYGRWLASEVLPWCSSLYLLIVGGMLVHYSRQYLRSRRIVREGLSSVAPAFEAFVSSTAGRMGIRTRVRAHLSTLVEVPVTLGFLKPVILLPVSMVTQLTTIQIEAILVHELAHIRRKDYLLNLLVTAMQLLYFFNPFTRMLIAELKKEREHCCDDAVLEFRYDPHTYVSALLSLAQQHQQTQLAVAAIGGGGEQLLLQRARKILQQKRTDDRPGPRPLIGLLLTALVSMVVLGDSRPARTNNPAVPLIVLRQPAHVETMSLVLVNTRPQRRPAVSLHMSHVHPARGHRRPQNLLEAILGESVPVLNTSGPAGTPPITFTVLVEATHKANRDYSMDRADGSQTMPMPDPGPAAGNEPFVPQSSFTFQDTDTLPPGEKLALMQELSRKALQLQVLGIQNDLRQQLFLLDQQAATIRQAADDEMHAGFTNTVDTQALKELLQQQMKVRKQYLINLQKLQRQLQKTSRHLTIVYI